MESADTREQVIHRIQEAFPSLKYPDQLLSKVQEIPYLRESLPPVESTTDLPESREWWAVLRSKLPRLVPGNAVVIVPFVLVDMAQQGAPSRFENGDMVIYFLDVLRDSRELRGPEMDALVKKFAEETIGGEEGEYFKSLMFSALPGQEGMSYAERRARELLGQMASFTEFTTRQAEAIYHWVRYIGRFELFEGYSVELMRSALYWYSRSGDQTGHGDQR